MFFVDLRTCAMKVKKTLTW